MLSRRNTRRMDKLGFIRDYLVKYPLRYCVPIYMGVLTRDEQTLLDSATATMLELRGRKLLVTDNHVIADGFEKYVSDDARVRFQAGREVFDPCDRCVDRNEEKDLFVIDASGLSFDDRSSDDQLPPLEFYKVPDGTQWPPPLITESDAVIFGGFPGAMREAKGFDVASGSYSIAAIPVTGSFPDHFSCTIDRSTWHSIRADDDWARDFRRWGGLSGGPVFQDGPGLLRPALTGFIQQYHPDLDQIHVSHAANLNVDGTIITGPLY